MSEPALDALPEWPWPRWEFVAATPTDDGVTVALAPIAGPYCPRISMDPDTLATVYDSRVVLDHAGRTVDSTGYEASFDG